MPTWVKSRVRAGRCAAPRVEALEERWMLNGGPGPSGYGAPGPHAPALFGSPPQQAAPADPSCSAPAARAGCAGTGQVGGREAVPVPQDCAPHLTAASGPAPPSSAVIAGPGRAAPADRPVSADRISGAPPGSGPVEVAGREASPAQHPAGEGTPSGPAGAATASFAPALFVLRREDNEGAADVPIADEAAPPWPQNGLLLPGGPGVPEALAASLPAARGLLAEGATCAVSAVGRAVEALAEPLRTEAGGTAGLLYWVGFSSWVVAAALACEGARRSRRRPTLALPATTAALPPEADL
jgi:hypothetical protein